jgi:AraC family transcriptional regulator
MASALSGAGVSSGRELRACQLAALRVSEIEVPAHLRLASHAHSAAQICFVLEASYRESWLGEERRLAPGDCFFRPAGLAHDNRFGSETALTVVVSFDPARLAAPAPRLPRRLDPALVGWMREEVRRELRREDPSSAYALEGLSLLLLAEVGRSPRLPEPSSPGAPEWLREAEHLIEDEHADRLTLAVLADRVGVHRATLAAGFRRHLGCSVGERLRTVRLRHAQRMLVTTRTPFSEVALACGFADQSHLGRVLRRATGLTPAGYRDRRRRG